MYSLQKWEAWFKLLVCFQLIKSCWSCSCVWTMSRGFLRGLSSNKAPPLLLPDVLPASSAPSLICERRGSAEILSPSVKCSPSSWISCLEPPESERGASAFDWSADGSLLECVWGRGETEKVGWNCGGLSLHASPPPPPSVDLEQPRPSVSGSSLSLDDSLLLLLLLSLLLSLQDPDVSEARCSSSITILAAFSSSLSSSSKSAFCSEAFCKEATSAATFLDLWM